MVDYTPPSAHETAPIDPLVLSMIRWFANAVENKSIEKYWILRKNSGEIRSILTHTLEALSALPNAYEGISDDEECPWDCPGPPCTPTCREE